jgi:exo-1,4-beta-D-glucosaminidase
MRYHLPRVAVVVCVLFTLSSFHATAQESPNLTELGSGWKMMSAKNVSVDDALVSQGAFDASHWYAAQHMPATVLQIFQENGFYKDIYFGTNLATPGDLWKQDWWYRTTFTAPRPGGLLSHLQRHQLPG